MALTPSSDVAAQLLCDFGTQSLIFFDGVIEFGTVLVAPLDGPDVVVVDAWEKSLGTDIVFGLGHIVETCIVHDTGRMTMLFDPCLVAKFLDRCS